MTKSHLKTQSVGHSDRSAATLRRSQDLIDTDTDRGVHHLRGDYNSGSVAVWDYGVGLEEIILEMSAKLSNTV
jgi:hypothetical protein